MSRDLGREMGRDLGDEAGRSDHRRYRQLLAAAVDEEKRWALIRLLIEERAMERLAADRRAAAHGAERRPRSDRLSK
ncbi:hypothetical protein [Bradyrhizobium sp.]|uniref:hypothetical protein n=1 Tax=Bradyrhizobium sp. TaxID=376 RepID=UPI0025BEAEF8|nr:hypothetical protein [Bradyrhizobium sp.]